MATLYKNCLLVDFKTGDSEKVDILVNGNKIVKIEKVIKENVDTVDVGGNIVMPPFCNCYFRSTDAFSNSYLNVGNSFCNGMISVDGDIETTFKNRELSAEEKLMIEKFLGYKNILAGALNFFNFSSVENLSNFNLGDLSKNIALDFANNQLSLFEESLPSEHGEEDSSYIEDLSEVEDKQLEEFCLNLKDRVIVKTGQNLEEMGKINSRTKIMPSEYLESFGILDKKAIIVGANCFEKDEINLMSGYDAGYVLLPNDDARSGRRFANLNLLKQSPIGIGSGDYAEIDFFANMRQILSYNSFVMEKNDLMSEREVLEIATTGGASLYGYDTEIKVGNDANFLVLSSKNIYSSDIFKGIVYELSKEDIYYVVINGKIICKNGVFVMENENKYDKIKECIRSILKHMKE